MKRKDAAGRCPAVFFFCQGSFLVSWDELQGLFSTPFLHEIGMLGLVLVF